MKKIGFVDYYLGEWHANNYPGWIDGLDCGYRVTHAWAELDLSPVYNITTAQWCEKYGVKQCSTIDELCDTCDVIVILAPSDPDKHLAYAEAVLKHGKPTYIDKTFAPDYETAVKIFDLAKKYNTPFFSTSALRFADELAGLAGGNNYIITGSGSNFPEYCIHMIEMAVKLLDDQVTSASTAYQGNQRFCSLTTETGKKATLVYTPAFPYSVTCDKADGKPVHVRVTSDFFANLIRDIIRFFEESTVSFDTAQTLEVMRVRDMLLK
jgi:predicted dehydrogenase